MPDTLDAAEFVTAIRRGEPLAGVLDKLVLAIEARAGGVAMLGSILLVKDGQLRHGAAPHLPAAYNAALGGVVIGPNVGSCGTAAYCGHAIFVVDIATDPLWKDFRDLALGHGLRACWSTPVMSASGQVVATFALYYREPHSPGEAERALIRSAAETAGAILDEAGRREGSGAAVESNQSSA